MQNFGINENLPNLFSMSLSRRTTLLKLTNAYGMIINGEEIVPSFIDRVQDRRGKQ